MRRKKNESKTISKSDVRKMQNDSKKRESDDYLSKPKT
jgi:hypothetical protein